MADGNSRIATPTIRTRLEQEAEHTARFEAFDRRASALRREITDLGIPCNVRPLQMFSSPSGGHRTAPVSYKNLRDMPKLMQRVRDAFGTDAPPELEMAFTRWQALAEEYNAYLLQHASVLPPQGKGR